MAVQEAMDIMQSDQLKIVADSEAVGVYGKHSKLSLAASQVALANTQQGTSAWDLIIHKDLNSNGNVFRSFRVLNS